MALEVIAIRRLYGRDHLDHVLGTFGLMLFFNELVRLIWGPAGMTLPLPSQMLTAVQVLPGVYYPAYRLVIIVATLVVALLLYVLVMRTRIGMLIRAGASNREMVGALGVNIKLLYTLVFGLGAALAGFAGLMQAPILTVQIGMGENILILAFVVIIIGGIGSIRGAFVAAIIVGLIDTIGRAFLPDLVRAFRQLQRGLEPRAVAVVDDDLHADGGGAGVPAGRSVPGGEQMTALAHPAQRVRRRAARCCSRCCRSIARSPATTFLMSLFTRILILAMAAVSLNLIMGFGGMVSFGHAAYLGIGGYAVGILAKEGINSGFVQWPVALAGLGAVRARRRRALPAHPRRLFHHDHARLRADGLLRRDRARPLRRRRRADDLQAQPVRRSDQSVEQDGLLLSVLRAAAGDRLSRLAAGQFALRHGDPGRALQRAAHARHRLSDVPLQARPASSSPA